MSTPRIPAAEMSGPYGAALKRESTRMFGRVATPLGVYWHNKAVLRSYLSISSKARRWEACEKDLKSYAHMAVAALIGCSWCLDLGYFQASNEGLDVAKAREVPRWRASTLFTTLERQVLDYAEAMSHTPPTVTDQMSAGLLDQLGEAALVELTSYISLANFYARTNVAFGVHSDGLATARGLPPLPPATSAAA